MVINDETMTIKPQHEDEHEAYAEYFHEIHDRNEVL